MVCFLCERGDLGVHCFLQLNAGSENVFGLVHLEIAMMMVVVVVVMMMMMMVLVVVVVMMMMMKMMMKMMMITIKLNVIRIKQ